QEIGHAVLSFGEALPKGSPVEITFTLGPDGLLSVQGKDLTTQREIAADFATNSILTDDALAQKKAHNMGLTVSS
ncbi:MAG: molecular chaperone DnaK, partial [Phenylobacterium sp.]